jgi:hypothetical protein
MAQANRLAEQLTGLAGKKLLARVGVSGVPEQRGDVVAMVRDHAELLGDGEGVVGYCERGIAPVLAVLGECQNRSCPGRRSATDV